MPECSWTKLLSCPPSASVFSSVKWSNSARSLTILSIPRTLSVLWSFSSPSCGGQKGWRKLELSGVVRTPFLASAHPGCHHVTRAILLSNREGLSPFVRNREESWWVRAHSQKSGEGSRSLRIFWYMVVVLTQAISNFVVYSASFPWEDCHLPLPVFQVRWPTMELCQSLTCSGGMT